MFNERHQWSTCPCDEINLSNFRKTLLQLTTPISSHVCFNKLCCWWHWFRFMFTSDRHSFASLIDTNLSRKATLMFQDMLLFQFFQQTYLILIYFHLNQLRNVCPLTAPGRQYVFFRTSQQPIRVRRSWPENKLSHIIHLYIIFQFMFYWVQRQHYLFMKQ